MTNISQLLNTSPSVELLRIRNREMTIEYFVKIFSNKQGAVSCKNIHTQLADFLEGYDVEHDEDSEINLLLNVCYVNCIKNFSYFHLCSQ